MAPQPNQSKSVPTDVQMKLLISQVLSLPAIYNAPVIVLDFEVDDDNTVKGRFRDSERPRVFSYEITEDGISFKPFNPKRMDTLEDFDVKNWEEFSEGYSYRLDTKKKSKARRQCTKTTSYNCGASCININKTCRVNPQDANSQARRKKLSDAVEAYKKNKDNASGGGGGGGEQSISPEKDQASPSLEIEKSFHVRDTLVDKDKFNKLPEDQKQAILDLHDQFNKLGYIDARTQIGPSQSARQSQKERDRIAQTASKAFEIEARIKSLLRTPEEKAIGKAEFELEKMNRELSFVSNQVKTAQDFTSRLINSKRDNATKREYQKMLDREKELKGLIDAKSLEIKELKVKPQQSSSNPSIKSTPEQDWSNYLKTLNINSQQQFENLSEVKKSVYKKRFNRLQTAKVQT